MTSHDDENCSSKYHYYITIVLERLATTRLEFVIFLSELNLEIVPATHYAPVSLTSAPRPISLPHQMFCFGYPFCHWDDPFRFVPLGPAGFYFQRRFGISSRCSPPRMNEWRPPSQKTPHGRHLEDIRKTSGRPPEDLRKTSRRRLEDPVEGKMGWRRSIIYACICMLICV